MSVKVLLKIFNSWFPSYRLQVVCAWIQTNPILPLFADDSAGTKRFTPIRVVSPTLALLLLGSWRASAEAVEDTYLEDHWHSEPAIPCEWRELEQS